MRMWADSATASQLLDARYSSAGKAGKPTYRQRSGAYCQPIPAQESPRPIDGIAGSGSYRRVHQDSFDVFRKLVNRCVALVGFLS